MIKYLIEYIEEKIQLLKLEASEKVILVGAQIALLICVMVFFIFFVVLLNIGLSIWIGGMLGHYSYGLFVVAGFYLLLIILCILFRKGVRKIMSNFIIALFYNHND